MTIEAFLLQGVRRPSALLRTSPGSNLPEPGLRWFAIAALSVFVPLLFALELPLTTIELRIGRRLETRLRILLLEKIPRLSDRYFHSRLTSDMTMRAHGLRSLRSLPTPPVNVLRLGFQLLLTTAGVIILDPANAPWAIAFALVFSAVAYFSNVIQREREMRLSGPLLDRTLAPHARCKCPAGAPRGGDPPSVGRADKSNTCSDSSPA